MKPKILSFGEIIWDVYETESLIGGAPLNFAAHCARCGADSYLISAVGKDDLGTKALRKVSDLGVNEKFIKCTDKTTGQCIVRLDAKGKPDFHVLENTAFDNITVCDEDISLINEIGFDALYFGTLIQRNGVSRRSLRQICEMCNFKEIICDINLRKGCYDENSVRFCLENATVLKLSNDEEPLLREYGLYAVRSDNIQEIAAAICARYTSIRYLIFTLGAEGSLVYCAATEHFHREKAKDIEVASTVGAGDSFIAAWATAYLSGASVELCTKRANELSNFVVSQTAAIPKYTFEGGVLHSD